MGGEGDFIECLHFRRAYLGDGPCDTSSNAQKNTEKHPLGASPHQKNQDFFGLLNDSTATALLIKVLNLNRQISLALGPLKNPADFVYILCKSLVFSVCRIRNFSEP